MSEDILLNYAETNFILWAVLFEEAFTHFSYPPLDLIRCQNFYWLFSSWCCFVLCLGNFSLNFSIPFSDIIFFIISTSLNQFSKSINTEKVETKGTSENLETASKVYAGEKTSVHEAAEKAHAIVIYMYLYLYLLLLSLNTIYSNI